MKILKSLFIAIALISYPSSAYATLNITIKDEDLSKNKILFIGFESSNFSVNNEAKQILQRIIYNLKTTNLAEPLVQNQIITSSQNNEIINTTSENLAQNTSQSIDFIDINAIPDFDKHYSSGIEV